MSGTGIQSRPQNEAINTTKIVAKGDVLETSSDFLQSAPMMVEWSQKWITRKEKYYFVVFENTSQGTRSLLLFSKDIFTHNILRR